MRARSRFLPFLFVLCVPLVLPEGLEAQEAITSFRVYTEPPNAPFRVDGRDYVGGATFLWPKGSKHIIEAVETRSPFAGTRYVLKEWRDASNNLVPYSAPVQTVTADPAVPSLQVVYAVHHLIRLRFFDGPVSPQPQCGAPGDAAPGVLRTGVVWIGDACFWTNADIWGEEGDIPINAFPYPGFVFRGWYGASGAYLSSFPLKGQVTLIPRFEPAKRVAFRTSPPGLDVIIDRTQTSTPASEPCTVTQALPPAAPLSVRSLCVGDYDFADGTQHVLSAPPFQSHKETGDYWVFEEWDIGGGQNTVYTVKDVNLPVTIRAKFVPGVRIALLTSPSGLKLNIDGRDMAASNFIWGVGSTHRFTAPPEQTDSSGRKYVFKRWSNGGPASQELKVEGAALEMGVRLTAEYELLGRTVLTSSPAGVRLRIDGQECGTPCVLDRPNGTAVSVSAPQSKLLNSDERLEFSGWSDGGGQERTITVENAARTITAHYQSHFRLQILVDPENGATIALSPASADLFYPSGAEVTATVQPNKGYRFRRWEGDAAGTYPIAQIRLNGPVQIAARLEAIYQGPVAEIFNAAGGSPGAAVASGSLISIFGSDLARSSVASEAPPLPQLLGGVIVRIAHRMFPLLFVSPEQINAQLPSDLEPGEYEVVIEREGQEAVKATVLVARNAPGLFSTGTEDRPLAVAYREDGSSVDAAQPARPAELVTILGTGFGPGDRPILDGFAAPEHPPVELVDRVDILFGDQVIPAEWAGVAPGQVGISMVKFRMPETPEADLPVSVRVNGATSNTVLIPLR
ncbi:MAG TPA: hypothetical protein VFQ79_24215 [Bryobacteraceae bacterium]|nr:hypothetical protein [Bryobacteraceae bacterium]